jgi:NADPH:quinone reductase-like Zn-dependent oxidoreductase
MAKRFRILELAGAVTAMALLAFALALSYESACPAPTQYSLEGATMRAIVQRCYGPPEVLALEQVAKPVPGSNEVLVKVHAASVNPADWHGMRGEPYVMRLSAGFGAPEDQRFGTDFAGVVEAVGSEVSNYEVGDAVFGARHGALAEYVLVRADRALAPKPDGVSFDEAAAVPVAAVTALQALRDQGAVQAGQKVLINGASGGVGTFAVQLARHFGAEVTGVCSTRNVELVEGLGAAHVIDYTREDFTQGAERYDLVVDLVGNRSLSDITRVLAPQGKLLIVGGPKNDPWIGPLSRPIAAAFLSPFVDQDLRFFIAQIGPADLAFLAGLMRDGKLRSVIDRRYAFEATRDAMTHLQTGRARGKIIVTIP